MGRVVIVAGRVLVAVLLVLAMGACELASVAPASRTLEGLGVDFQQQPAPAGFDQEATLDRIQREYGVGVDRPPDAVTYGMAVCIDPGCFGDDVGEGPLRVWLIEWTPDQAAESRRLLVDAATGALLRFE